MSRMKNRKRQRWSSVIVSNGPTVTKNRPGNGIPRFREQRSKISERRSSRDRRAGGLLRCTGSVEAVHLEIQRNRVKTINGVSSPLMRLDVECVVRTRSVTTAIGGVERRNPDCKHGVAERRGLIWPDAAYHCYFFGAYQIPNRPNPKTHSHHSVLYSFYIFGDNIREFRRYHRCRHEPSNRPSTVVGSPPLLPDCTFSNVRLSDAIANNIIFRDTRHFGNYLKNSFVNHRII